MSRRGRDHLHYARGELRLARRADAPLREVPLAPDPLGVFARVFDQVRPDLDEDLTVAIDLLPASPQRRRRLRRWMLEQASDREHTNAHQHARRWADDFLDEVAGGHRRQRGGGDRRTDPAGLIARRHELRQLSTKLLDVDAMFELQVLFRARSRVPERADMLYQGVLSAFEIFGADNEFRVSGVNVAGAVFFGSDMPWRRGWFDHRLHRGIFAPNTRRGGSIVNARELAGLLKPPTRHCASPNVLRAGPYLAPPPRDLPAYRQQRGVIPLGRVRRGEEQLMVGMDSEEFFFGGVFGRSRFGKTELSLVQLAHVALVERGGALLFDPHVDGIERLKPYLTSERDRIVELNLARRSLDAPHVAWNLMSMTGLGTDRLADRARAVVDSFALAGGYSGSRSPRTVAILENAVTSLLHLALQLPAELQPTVLTIARFLLDEDWRTAAIPRLPEHLARYWTTTFANYPADAAGPLCQLVSRLELNPTVRATFGSPQSTYDPRRAMDTGQVVLASPPTVTDELVSSLIMQGHIDAARSRADTPPERRRVFYLWFDETQIYDRSVSSSRGTAIAEILEQTAKYGIRAVPMAQSPHRLSEHTIEALTTNASFLITTATSPKGARFFAEQWDSADARSAVQQLPRWHYIAQPTHRGRRVEPFRLDGLPIEEVWADYHHPEQLPELDAAIDHTCRPHTVRETLELIDGHDDQIFTALTTRMTRVATSVDGPPTVGRDDPTHGPDEPRRPGASVIEPIRPMREPQH